MFLLLCFEEKNVKRFKKSDTKMDYMPVHCSHYVRINSITSNGKADWNRIKKLCGGYCKCTVCNLPSSSMPADFIPAQTTKFCTYLLENLCVQLAKSFDFSPTIGIFDPFGKIRGETVFALMGDCKEVIINTARPDKFSALSAKCLNLLGAQPIITGNSTQLKNCDFLLSPFFLPPLGINSKLPIIGLGGFQISDLEVILPMPFCDQKIPENAKISFLSALYYRLNLKNVEYSKIRSFEKLKMQIISAKSDKIIVT